MNEQHRFLACGFIAILESKATFDQVAYEITLYYLGNSFFFQFVFLVRRSFYLI